jgi:peptidoglycan/LPS O-acetylase OafA/YrhL
MSSRAGPALETPIGAGDNAAGFEPGIEVLRGVAALSVCIFHLYTVGGWRPPPPLSLVGISGWMGVDLFFVISGYVIGGSVARHAFVVRDGILARNPEYAREYWRSRVARIVPLYALTCVIFLVLRPAVLAHGALWQIATHATFLHNLFPSTITSVNGVTWSLAVEAQLYLLAFLIVPVLVRGAPALRCAAFALALAIPVAFRAAGFWASADAAVRGYLALQTPALLDGFGIGVLMWLWHSARGAGRTRTITAWARCAGAFIVAALLLTLAHLTYAAHPNDYYVHFPMVLFHRSLVAAGCAALVLAAVWLPRGRPPPRPLLWLGRLSYGIYLWHGVLLFGIVARFGGAWTSDAKAALVLAGSVVLAEASWRLIERPGQRAIKRLFVIAGERPALAA